MMDLTHALNTVRRRWLARLALRVSARALLAASGIAAGAALAERWLQPSDHAALALAVAAGLAAVAAPPHFPPRC